MAAKINVQAFEEKECICITLSIFPVYLLILERRYSNFTEDLLNQMIQVLASNKTNWHYTADLMH